MRKKLFSAGLLVLLLVSSAVYVFAASNDADNERWRPIDSKVCSYSGFGLHILYEYEGDEVKEPRWVFYPANALRTCRDACCINIVNVYLELEPLAMPAGTCTHRNCGGVIVVTTTYNHPFRDGATRTCFSHSFCLQILYITPQFRQYRCGRCGIGWTTTNNIPQWICHRH